MATSQVVDLAVGSEFGFKRPAFAPVPIMETIKSFNTNTSVVGSLANTSSRVLIITPPMDFEFPKGNTATLAVLAAYGTGTNQVLKSWTLPFKQNISISNVGTADVTIFPNSPFRPTFSPPPPALGLPGTYPVIHSINGSPVTTSTFVIHPGATSGFEIAYYGTDPGDYTSSLTIESTAGISTVTLYTNQFVRETLGFQLASSPVTVNTSVDYPGAVSATDVQLYGVVNGVADYTTQIQYTASMVGYSGWEIGNINDNQITVLFRAAEVGNTAGTYTADLVISAAGLTDLVIPLTATVGEIDHANNYHMASWSSAASSYNSIVGVSLDMYRGVKTVTIGVGMGGNGTPLYGQGGSAYVALDALGINGIGLQMEYPYWAYVVSVPLPAPGTYLSGALSISSDLPEYVKKTTAGLNYADYFGYERGLGSMFIVELDAAGNVLVKINNLLVDELSGHAIFDATLKNLTRAFFYFSSVDQPARYTQLSPGPIVDGTVTELFLGFTKQISSGAYVVNSSIVPLPA